MKRLDMIDVASTAVGLWVWATGLVAVAFAATAAIYAARR